MSSCIAYGSELFDPRSALAAVIFASLLPCVPLTVFKAKVDLSYHRPSIGISCLCSINVFVYRLKDLWSCSKEKFVTPISPTPRERNNMASSLSRTRGYDPNRTRTRRQSRPFVSVAPIISRLEQLSKLDSIPISPISPYTKSLPIHSLKPQERLERLEKKNALPQQSFSSRRTATAQYTGKPKPEPIKIVNPPNMDKSLPPTPTSAGLRIKIPSGSISAPPTPVSPSNWTPPLDWEVIPRQQRNGENQVYNIYGNSPTEPYLSTPHREELELIIPEPSPLASPKSITSSIMKSPLQTKVPPGSPIGLGVSTLSNGVYLQYQPKIDGQWMPPARRLSSSAPSTTMGFAIEKRLSKPIRPKLRLVTSAIMIAPEQNRSPLARLSNLHFPNKLSPVKLSFLQLNFRSSRSKGGRKASNVSSNLHSVGSFEELRHIPDSPPRVVLRSTLPTEPIDMTPNPNHKRRSTGSGSSSIYAEDVTTNVIPEEERWEGDIFEQYSDLNNLPTPSPLDEIADEYRELATPSFLNRMSYNYPQTQTTPDSANLDIRLVPHPLFWAKPESNHPHTCAAPSKLVRRSSVRRRSSALSNRSQNSTLKIKYNISSPTLQENTTITASQSPTTPQTPTRISVRTISSSTPKISHSTPPLSHTASPISPRSPNTPTSSNYYPFSPISPTRSYTSTSPISPHRSVTSLGTPSIRSPPPSTSPDADPAITYVTKIPDPRKHARKRQKTSRMLLPKKAFTSAMKSVRTQLSPNLRQTAATTQNESLEVPHPHIHTPSSEWTSEEYSFSDSEDNPPVHVAEQQSSGAERAGGLDKVGGTERARRGLKELLAEKRGEREERRRRERLKKTIYLVGSVDPGRVEYDVREEGGWV